jgi:hypothetical protein
LQWLLKVCETEAAANQPDETFFCVAYVTGASNVMALNGFGARQIKDASEAGRYLHNSGMCPEQSKEPSPDAEKQAFMNWARAHPERWTDPMIDGVMAALSQTWPCTSG